jgi:hypothetical protein
MVRRRNAAEDEDEDAPRSRTASSSDEELNAIQKCVSVLENLNDDSAANVIAYLARRYDAD